MADYQFPIWLNNEHKELVSEFQAEVIKLEQCSGHLGDYVADALEFYLHHMKHYPEKIGKERHTFSNLSKSQQRTNKFIEKYGETLKCIGSTGLDYIAFYRLLENCFKKSYKTLKAYENEILTNAQWSIINIPKSQKKIVLHRQSELYELVKRFDMTLKNYYSGLRPTKAEDKAFEQIRRKLLPQKDEIDDIFYKSFAVPQIEAEEEEE